MTDGLWHSAKLSIQRCATSYSDPSDKQANEQILITEHDDCLCVSIAGSNDVYDWLQNCNLDQVELGDHYISEGVLRAAKNVMAMVVHYKSGMDSSSGKPIQFEGHSKGGAVALACSMMANLRDWDVHQVITFACPRITRERIVYPYKVTQFVATGDPIPSLPPWRPWRKWRHNGRIIKVGKQTVANVTREWFGNIARPIKMHMIKNYISIFN